jgi:type IV secretion system protein VirB5
MDSRTQWAPEGPLDTPYRRARDEWDARMGAAVVHAKNWRLATFASLGAVALSIGGLVVLGAQPKAVPHIIEVDHLGAAIYRGPITQSADAPPSDPAIKYELRRFLEDTRTLSSDVLVLKRNWLDAYTLVTAHAGNTLSAYVQVPGNDPAARSQEQRVAIEILSTVRVSSESWQVDWRETTYDKSGAPSGAPAIWRAMFRLLSVKPKTEADMAKNPLGLFIEEFHWDRVQG